MEAVAQSNASIVLDEKQFPPSRTKGQKPKHLRVDRGYGEDTASAAPAALTTVQEGFLQGGTKPSFEVEEFFEGVVEEIADDEIQLRTVSSAGEEGVAWLPLSKIPDGERKFIRLGAPARVSIVLSQDGTVRREHQVRFLRPSQWQQATPAVQATDYLLEQMKKILGGSSAG